MKRRDAQKLIQPDADGRLIFVPIVAENGSDWWRTVWRLVFVGLRLADIVADRRDDRMVAFRVISLSLLCAFPATAADLPVPSNPEMAAIFKADQADRTNCEFRLKPAMNSDAKPATIPA